MMIKLLLFLGIILSIVKANGWFIVPMPVLVFCWVGSFVCWMIYSYALGVGEGAAKEMKRKSTTGRADNEMREMWKGNREFISRYVPP